MLQAHKDDPTIFQKVHNNIQTVNINSGNSGKTEDSSELAQLKQLIVIL